MMFIILIHFLFLCEVTSKQSSTDSCYVYPSCLTDTYYDKTTGFSNDTGWLSSESSQCCQICLPGTPPVVCFDSTDPECASKTGNADYDYILFDQIWLPQFCHALDMGHDLTLSHLENSSCKKNVTSSLSIHGVWPNYFGGYPQCCDATEPTVAISPNEVIEWTIWPDLKKQWSDPTQECDYCGVCYMLNHEWEKHGTCYSPGNPVAYFEYGLNLNSKLQTYNELIIQYAGTTVLTSTIKALYPKAVNVICDPKDDYYPNDASTGFMGSGVFSEIQTCWDRNNNMIDCPPAGTYSFTAPCPSYTIFR
jgi:ribonuclease T2